MSWRLPARLRPWLGAVLAAGLLLAIGLQHRDVLGDLPGVLGGVGLGGFAASVALFVSGSVPVFLAYVLLAGAFRVDAGLRQLGHLYFVGQLLKYLPGRVWGFVFQAVRAADLAPVGVWSSLVAIHFLAATAALLSVAAAILLGAGAEGAMWMALLAITSTAVSVLLVWRGSSAITLLSRIFPSVAARWGGGSPAPVSLARLSGALVLLHLGPLLQAAAFVPLVLAMEASSGAMQAMVDGANYLLAWLAGYVVVLVPAGLGVREGAYALLSDGRPPGLVLALAVAARLAMMASDLLLGLAFSRYPVRRGGAED